MRKKPLLSRRFSIFLGTFVLLIGVCTLDGFVIEPHWIEVTHHELLLPHLPLAFDGMMIAQLSDLHYDSYRDESFIRHAVTLTNRLHPDIIVLTGDYSSRSVEYATACAKILHGLRAPYGVYGILGNHDVWVNAKGVARALRSEDISVLINAAQPITKTGASLWIAGLDDIWSGLPDIDRTIGKIPPGSSIVLLAHEPDYADIASRYPIDLQLSGHSHGGQVTIPFFDPPLVPAMSRKYPRGLYHIGGLTLYTNRGLGTVPPKARFCCRPEITLFTLRSPRLNTRAY